MLSTNNVCCVLCGELVRCLTDVLVWPAVQCGGADVELVKYRKILQRASVNVMGKVRIRLRLRVRVRDRVSVSAMVRINSRILQVRQPYYTSGWPV